MGDCQNVGQHYIQHSIYCFVNTDCHHGCHHHGEVKVCINHYCECRKGVDGGWAEWSTWNHCTVTCGTGSKQRHRTCTNPAPSGSGSHCPGSDQERTMCHLSPCPVNGGWARWSAWSHCPVTCGIGRIQRHRTCTNPAPSASGSPCHGSHEETTHCHLSHCPVNGGWASWSAWGHCTVTCDTGTKQRHRTCTNPAPSGSGSPCHGFHEERTLCHHDHCPIDGGWSNWEAWTTCSVTCGTGIEIRRRHCSNPVPKYGGSQCPGNETESSTCTGTCNVVDGSWSSWGAWSSCTDTCGNFSARQRIRHCDKPAPVNGKPCTGAHNEISACNVTPCPVGPDCPTCDESLNCTWNNTCDITETCMIRQYSNAKFTVHCSKTVDCDFEKTTFTNGEIFCCNNHACLVEYLGIS
ncbi:coadhesin-like [Saccostrea echinata]|uniref:coadhesin-like n=1 Tax=Saccostrea echinata TaxID=191078 RepID=UPI002A7EF9B8|nr:coadhesin-like [Saccostrea echinata]